MEHRDAGKMQVACRLLLTPPFRYLWNVTTEGLENVPTNGAAIIAPNHISVLDSFFVPLCLGRRMTYVGKAEYMDDWKTKYLFPAIGMIPIDRSGGDAAQRALDAAARVLTSGELFGIYPEGTRARDGYLHKGHTGIARLALTTNSPIVPVGIVGSDLVQPADARLPKFFRRVHLRFGKPISVERYLDRANDRLVLRQITDEVMFEIRNLSGQHYVNTYATKPVAEAGTQTEVESSERLAEVVDLPVRRKTKESATAAQQPTVVVASAASQRPVTIMVEADGVDRRSSAAAIKTRKLDLPFELELSTA
jgi:1-acyl-sn-glycerol-3-phosphate acyltransferase